MVESKVLGECPEFAVGNFVANEASRQGHRVDRSVREFRALIPCERGLEEREIETDVVTDNDRIADELEERR